ncbi:hypothetical protein RI367_004377 [Sorochytrium milnesiophthora]
MVLVGDSTNAVWELFLFKTMDKSRRDHLSIFVRPIVALPVGHILQVAFMAYSRDLDQCFHIAAANFRLDNPDRCTVGLSEFVPMRGAAKITQQMRIPDIIQIGVTLHVVSARQQHAHPPPSSSPFLPSLSSSSSSLSLSPSHALAASPMSTACDPETATTVGTSPAAVDDDALEGKILSLTHGPDPWKKWLEKASTEYLITLKHQVWPSVYFTSSLSSSPPMLSSSSEHHHASRNAHLPTPASSAPRQQHQNDHDDSHDSSSGATTNGRRPMRRRRTSSSLSSLCSNGPDDDDDDDDDDDERWSGLPLAQSPTVSTVSTISSSVTSQATSSGTSSGSEATIKGGADAITTTTATTTTTVTTAAATITTTTATPSTLPQPADNASTEPPTRKPRLTSRARRTPTAAAKQQQQRAPSARQQRQSATTATTTSAAVDRPRTRATAESTCAPTMAEMRDAKALDDISLILVEMKNGTDAWSGNSHTGSYSSSSSVAGDLQSVGPIVHSPKEEPYMHQQRPTRETRKRRISSTGSDHNLAPAPVTHRKYSTTDAATVYPLLEQPHQPFAPRTYSGSGELDALLPNGAHGAHSAHAYMSTTSSSSSNSSLAPAVNIPADEPSIDIANNSHAISPPQQPPLPLPPPPLAAVLPPSSPSLTSSHDAIRHQLRTFCDTLDAFGGQSGAKLWDTLRSHLARSEAHDSMSRELHLLREQLANEQRQVYELRDSLHHQQLLQQQQQRQWAALQSHSSASFVVIYES